MPNPGSSHVQNSFDYQTLDYVNQNQADGTQLFGIDDNGTICGTAFDSARNGVGFTYSNGGFVSLRLVAVDTVSMVCGGINSRGDLVGDYTDAAKKQRAWSRIKGVVQSYEAADVPNAVLTTFSGINDRGDVVGSYTDTANASHGFVYRGGQRTDLTLPGVTAVSVSAFDINNAGDVVGYYTDGQSKDHGFLLTGGQTITIDCPNSIRTIVGRITNSGNVVGWYTTPDKTPGHGFYLDKKDVQNPANRVKIDAPNSRSTRARGINDRGDIVGVYIGARRRKAAWLHGVKALNSYRPVAGPGPVLPPHLLRCG